jgi:hypothetical protein
MAGEQEQVDAGTEKVLVARTDAGPPPWELRYDDPDKTTILHRHGAAVVPTQVTERGDGLWVAKCSECEASLELGGASGPGAGDRAGGEPPPP